MRLLLTRALADAQRTRAKLEAQGHEVVLMPVMEMVATGAMWPSGAVDGLLASSAQAFDMLANGPTTEARRMLPLYLVGARTHAAAVDHGFLGASVARETADALAADVERQGRHIKRLVYLAGRDRKPTLETELARLGISIEVVEVYVARETATCDADALAALHGGLDGIVHYSRRSAALLLKKAGAHDVDVVSPAHYCLSEDVAAPLREAGCATIHVASTPTEADLLALIGRSQGHVS